jgi:hypothetical protein
MKKRERGARKPPFLWAKLSPCFFGLVKVEPLRGFGKNLHPASASLSDRRGSIFPENLDKPRRAMPLPRKGDSPAKKLIIKTITVC